MVMETISVPSGTSGSFAACGAGASGAFADFGAGASCVFACGFWTFDDGADSAAFCCGAGFDDLIAALSSPSPRITAMGVFTATSAVPSGTRIFPSVPSSVASTSIVALSVSISAMMSPDFTSSPSFLSHLARLPFSIVGESAGMSTSIGMAYCFPGNKLAIHIGIKFGDVRLRIVGGKFRRLVDQVANFAVNLLQCIFGGEFLFQNSVTRHVDRVVMAAYFIHFFARSVLRGVRHRMPAIPVGQHFEDIGALAGSAPFGGLFSGRFHGTHIHTVDLVTGNIERQPPTRQVDLRRRTRDRRPHRIAIILDHVDRGQLPQLRHVEAFVDLALIGGAVAEICDADVAVAAVVVGESKTGTERHLRAHNSVPAVETFLHAEHVHGAALAFGIAVRAAMTPLGSIPVAIM